MSNVEILLEIAVLIPKLVSGGSFGIVSTAAVGVGMGILGYYLGTGRLGTVTIIVAIVTLFLGIAASQGVIPGLEPTDRNLPAVEPRAAE